VPAMPPLTDSLTGADALIATVARYDVVVAISTQPAPSGAAALRNRAAGSPSIRTNRLPADILTVTPSP